MKTATINTYSLSYGNIKTYLFAALFISGNIILPQICHLIPQGGLIFLPIYFFTLIGAYKYGFKVGLLTAVLSPVINHILFGMPNSAMLIEILTKSILLAGSASYIAYRTKNVSILSLLCVVLAYQAVYGLAKWIIIGNSLEIMQSLYLAIPGLLIQIFGSYILLKNINKNN